jgi:hypothetical protein
MCRLLLVLLAVAASAATVAQAHAAEGNFLVQCSFDHAAVADPIGGALHIHDFGGAVGIGQDSTVDSLLRSPTTCQVGGETPGVWHPAIVQPDGTRVDYSFFKIYYRNPSGPASPVLPFPLGMKQVHGNAHNRSANTYAAVYQCVGGSGTSAYIPTSCPQGRGIEENMYFASCWDGVSLDPSDHKPMKACDAAHPIHLPAINLIVEWPQAAVGGKLTSDIEEGVAGGLTSHADYWFTLDPFFFTKVVERCLNAGIQCRVANGMGPSPPPPAGSIYQFGTTNVILTAAEAQGVF